MCNSLLYAQNYKVVYKYFPSKVNGTELEELLLSIMQKSMFDNLTYECITNDSFNVIIPLLNKQKSHIEHGKYKVNASFNNVGAGYVVLDYINRIIIENFENKHRCSKIDTIAFIKTENKSHILGYMCEEWRPVLKKFDDIRIWSSTKLKWFINPGIFLPKEYGGIVMLNVKNKGTFKLVQLNKISSNVTTISPCNGEIIDKFNMADIFLQKKTLELR